MATCFLKTREFGDCGEFRGIAELVSSDQCRNDLRANAQKNRAKSTNRGHSSKPNLPSFSVCNKVLMSL